MTRQEQRKENERQIINDLPAAFAVARSIRDNENAADADRLAAIRLIIELKQTRQ